MTEDKLKEYFKLMEMLAVSNYALEWIESGGFGDYGNILTMNKYLYEKLTAYGINNF